MKKKKIHYMFPNNFWMSLFHKLHLHSFGAVGSKKATFCLVPLICRTAWELWREYLQGCSGGSLGGAVGRPGSCTGWCWSSKIGYEIKSRNVFSCFLLFFCYHYSFQSLCWWIISNSHLWYTLIKPSVNVLINSRVFQSSGYRKRN